MSDKKTLLERAWEEREERLYPALFGAEQRGIFVAPMTLFTEVFQQKEVDPRWLHFGVIEFAPTTERKTWVYVTSGMSTPWEAEAPQESSGLGCEFAMESSEQGDWAINQLLKLMVFQILLCHGRFPGKEPLGDYHRLPIGGPIRSEASELTYLMMAPPAWLEGKGKLESGRFDFYQVVGITEAEAAFAREKGGDVLVAELARAGVGLVTMPERKGLVLK